MLLAEVPPQPGQRLPMEPLRLLVLPAEVEQHAQVAPGRGHVQVFVALGRTRMAIASRKRGSAPA